MMNTCIWLCLMLFTCLRITSTAGVVCTKDKVVGEEKFKDDPNKVDTDTKTSFMVRDPTYIVSCCGVISEWTVFVMNSGTVHLQIWRDLGTGSYIFVGENLATYHKGEEGNFYKLIVAEEKQISVQEGDYLGWYTEGKSIPGYTTNKNGFGVLSASLKQGFEIGDEVNWSKGKVSSPRTYGISAKVTKANQPKFKNLDADLEIGDDIEAGSIIYVLSFDGYETGIRPFHYKVTMETVSEFFIYNSTLNAVYMIKEPSVNKMVLDFVVENQCGTSSKGKMKLDISKKNPRIRNLPSSAFVREDIRHVEFLLKVINTTYKENVICTIQKVDPPKTSTYFTMKALKDNQFVYGVYVKSNADMNYDHHDLFILTVKCVEGKESDSQDLYVYVEANKAPMFVNIPGSFHVDAKTARIADSLYQVNATDEERNVLRYHLLCDNVHPCPFNITKDGTVFLQQSLNRTIAKIVFLNITVEDGFNLVGPNILIANVTNFNRPPYIEDMSEIVVSLHENSPEHTILYEVSAHDPDDDDVITFSLDVKPSKMRSFFAINETSGVVTAISPVDYEGVKFRVSKLIVTASDGKDETSSFLRVALVDENEPPEFVFGFFTMHIAEGDPQPKNDLRIKARDSDKSGSITFAMECDNNSAAFQINENTGVVSQVMHVDIDELGVTELVIECNISAIDTGGLSSYAPLTIIVEDINDNSPNFPKTSYTFVISNYVPVYSEIGNVMAIDKDTSEENNLIFYHINSDLNEFIIDDNGTIFIMKDVNTVPFGSVFRYNVSADDKDMLSDVVPVTIVIIYNLDPAFMPRGGELLSHPQNVAWIVTATYASIIALGLAVFLVSNYVTCSIKKRRRISDSRSCDRMSVNSVMSTKMYTNVFDRNIHGDSLIVSPIPPLRCSSVHKLLTTSQIARYPISKLNNNTIKDNTIKSNWDTRDEEELKFKQLNLSVSKLPYQSTPYPRMTSEEQNSVIGEPPANLSSTTGKPSGGSSKSPLNRSLITDGEQTSASEITRKLNSSESKFYQERNSAISQSIVTTQLNPGIPKCTLSDTSPSGSGSWKPWSVKDF